MLQEAHRHRPTEEARRSRRIESAGRSEVIRYIHRNPVKRGLVEKPEDWPWSSSRHYATGEQGTVEIESQWTAFWRGNQLPAGVRVEYVGAGNSPARSSQKAR